MLIKKKKSPFCNITEVYYLDISNNKKRLVGYIYTEKKLKYTQKIINEFDF